MEPERYPTSVVAKVTLAALFGTMIDYYDFFVSGVAASSVWPKVFFPFTGVAAALLLSLTTYAVGFFSRPIGSFVFGNMGDRRGRKNTLMWTLIVSGLCTLGMGLVPSFYTIGLAAPVILTLLRFGQGLGLGGEWGGATTWVVEVSSKGKRGFWAGFVANAVFFGLILANLTFIALESVYRGSAFLNIGWRIAFIIGAVVVLIGAAIRYALMESPLFKKILESGAIENMPAVRLLRKEWKKVLLLTGTVLYITAVGYLSQVFSIGYLAARKIPPPYTITSVIIAGVAGVVFGLIGMYLADIIGRKKMILIGQLAVLLLSVPMFYLIQIGSPPLTRLAIIVLTATEGLGFSSFSSFLSEQFDTKYRFSGSGLSYQLATPFAGGLGPIIASSLLVVYGLSSGIYVGVEVLIYTLIGILCLIPTVETKGRELG
jgi:MFS family permease